MRGFVSNTTAISPSKQKLLDAYIQPGHARTCIAEGLVALGAPAYRDITLDGQGSDLEQLRVLPWMLAGAVDESYVRALQAPVCSAERREARA
jgi:hypothetical protein